MYYTECERLAERHPDLADAVASIDEAFSRLAGAEVIRPGDLASFLGLDQNRTRAVLDLLAGDGVLNAEEMVECPEPDCGMVVAYSHYLAELEEEDEYRCTSCDRPWIGVRPRPIRTYRRGEKWREPIVESREPAPLLDGPATSYPKDVRLFRRQGATWLIVFDGDTKTVPDMIGMTYICHLLQNPHQEIHSSVLRGLAAGASEIPILGSAGEALDEESITLYREQIAELDDEIEEANVNNDIGRVEMLNTRRQAVEDEITRATGLGGRSRRVADDRERIRQAVSVAIRRAIKAIKNTHPSFRRHLDNALKSGEFLSYQPESDVTWIA